MKIWVRFPRTGEMVKLWHFKFFLELYCEKRLISFEFFCPLHSTSGVKHRYPTRTANKRVVAEASLAVANTSFRWRASTQFAALPEDIKSEQNTKLFLNKLKRFTLENVKP